MSSLPHWVLGSQGWPGSSKGSEESWEEMELLSSEAGKQSCLPKAGRVGRDEEKHLEIMKEGLILIHIEIQYLKITVFIFRNEAI